jgi:hypothetical protein
VLAQIGQDMNVGGDILIYACNTAEGDKGINFVDSLAQLTGRDIAASTNRTGLGGDWTWKSPPAPSKVIRRCRTRRCRRISTAWRPLP